MAAPARFDKHAILAAHPLFRDLSGAIIQRLAAYAVNRKVKAGATVFRKGDTGSALYAVCSGTVRISVPSEQGKGAVFNSLGPGSVFGEIALLDGGPRTADAVAAEACEFMVIERRDFVALMREYPELALRIIEVLCARLRRTSEQVEDLVFLGLQARLAKALLRSIGETAAGGRHEIKMTQRELAQMIGMSREITNKQLREWQERKWIGLERGKIVLLAPDALKKLVAAAE